MLQDGDNTRVNLANFAGDLDSRALARPIRAAADVEAMLQEGGARKAVAATQMNAASSRSHSVFSVYVWQHHDGDRGRSSAGNRVLKSTLHMVDLAGSESIHKSGAEGERFA